MITIRRFPKTGGGLGDDDASINMDAQGSKCNLLDDNNSALASPMVNFRRGAQAASSASSGVDVEAGIVDHDVQRDGVDRYSSTGNERYQQVLKEAYSGAHVRQKSPLLTAGGGALGNGPASENTYGQPKTNVTRPIAGAPRFAYVPPSSLQSTVVNKSQSMDALKHNAAPAVAVPPRDGQAPVHSSVPPRLSAGDYKRPLSFTQAVQLHDTLTHNQSRVTGDGNGAAANAKPGSGSGTAAAGRRSATGTGNVNEIRV